MSTVFMVVTLVEVHARNLLPTGTSSRYWAATSGAVRARSTFMADA